MLRRFVLVSIVVSFVIFSVQLTSYAQDGNGEDDLSEYERLLLDRFVDAMLIPTSYANYTQTGTVKDLQELKYNLSGQPASISTGTQTQYETTVINTEVGKNTQTFVTLQYQDVAPDETIVYGMSVEIRVVDNQLYVQARYAESSAELPVLLEGWIQVENTTDHPELAELNLDDYRDTASIFENRELLAQSLSAINIESQVINGVNVQTISMAFRGADFIPVFKAMQPEDAPANTGSPLFDAIFANLSENTEIVMSVAADSENNPLIFALNIILETTPLDLSTIDAENFTSTDTLVVRLLVQHEDTLATYNTSDIEPILVPKN